MSLDASGETTLDSFLGGRLRLRQFRKGHHRAGTDGVLAAMHAAELIGEAPARVVDLGAGSGVIGLSLALLRPGAHATLVERDSELAGLCAGNIALNGLESRSRVVAADVLGPARTRHAAGLLSASADCVITNPPWFDEREVRASPESGRRAAHVFGGGAEELATADAEQPHKVASSLFPEDNLTAWVRTACDLLVLRGQLVMIHRAEALPALLRACLGRFGGVRVCPVHPRAGEPAIRVLLSGTKGSRAPFALLPPLVLHEAAGRFTPLAAALHDGQFVPAAND